MGRHVPPRCSAEKDRIAGCSDLDVSGGSHYRSQSLNSVWTRSYVTLLLGGVGCSSERAAYCLNGLGLPSGLGKAAGFFPNGPARLGNARRRVTPARHCESSPSDPCTGYRRGSSRNTAPGRDNGPVDRVSNVWITGR
jgi:hypothetical protein